MTTIHLLAARETARGLDDFVQGVVRAIRAADVEARESSNYPESRYFVASLGGLTVTMSLSDETGHDDLPYWIQIKSAEMDPRQTEVAADALVTQLLIPAGHRVAKLQRFGRRDELRVDY